MRTGDPPGFGKPAGEDRDEETRKAWSFAPDSGFSSTLHRPVWGSGGAFAEARSGAGVDLEVGCAKTLRAPMPDEFEEAS